MDNEPKKISPRQAKAASRAAKVSPPPPQPVTRLGHMRPGGPPPKKQKVDYVTQGQLRSIVFDTVQEALNRRPTFTNESIERIAIRAVAEAQDDMTRNYVGDMTYPQLLQTGFLELNEVTETVDAQSSKILKLEKANKKLEDEIDRLKDILEHRK